jgi:F0F1-type ATP synthase assembly protein I
MPQAPKLSIVQGIVLAVVAMFLVLTWIFGGIGGYSTGVGATLPWFVAIFAIIYEAFEKYFLNERELSSFRFGGAVALIFVFALIPISWLSLCGISISAILGPLTVLAYVLYGVHLTYGNKNLKQDTDKKRSSHKTHIFFLMLTFPVLSLKEIASSFDSHSVSGLSICLAL